MCYIERNATEGDKTKLVVVVVVDFRFGLACSALRVCSLYVDM